MRAMVRFGARALLRHRGRCLVRVPGLGPSPVLPAVFCGGTVRVGWRRSRLGDSGVGEISRASSGLLRGSLLSGCALVLGGAVSGCFLGFGAAWGLEGGVDGAWVHVYVSWGLGW